MNLRLYETRHRAGDAIAYHRHDAGYASLILTGMYDEVSVDGRWRCRAGDLIIHPPFHLHANRFADCGARVLNYRFEFNAQNLAPLHVYGVYRASPFVSLVRERTDILRLCETVENADIVAPQCAADWVDDVAETLAQNPAQRIALIAHHFGYSAEHVTRAFRMRFGMSPVAYRGEIRFRRIIGELTRAKRSLAAIAYGAGFSDQAHMARIVRAKTGLTPTQIRTAFS
jgi:AraC family transcriptional regulator